MKIYHLFPCRSPHIVPYLMQIFYANHQAMGTKWEDHYFVVYGDTEEERQQVYRLPGVPWQEIIFLKPRPDVLARFFWSIPADAMLVLHGVVYRSIWFALFSRPSLWRRAAWLIWGDDAYSFGMLKKERWVSLGMRTASTSEEDLSARPKNDCA